MADQEHLAILEKGVKLWNAWRKEHPDIKPDLIEANLRGAALRSINLEEAKLKAANLTAAKLQKANLQKANLKEVYLFRANLRDANLHRANLTEAKLQGANLTRALLTGANLQGAYLKGANLTEANLEKAKLKEASCKGAKLQRANLKEAILERADLPNADLSEATLEDANLVGAVLLRTSLKKADLTKCRIYGISAWDLVLDETKQEGLIVSPEGEPAVTVDDIEVAQFIYFMLSNKKIRRMINTITAKAVLILGRFAPERKVVLNALRDQLRTRDYLPIIFDFEKPDDRDFTETVMTLAGMSKFIIADITQPKSSPLEAHATITTYMIPFIPIIQEGEWPFAMFVDLQRKHHWVFNTLQYKDKDDLLQYVDKIVERADAKYKEIQLEKAKAAQGPVSGEAW